MPLLSDRPGLGCGGLAVHEAEGVILVDDEEVVGVDGVDARLLVDGRLGAFVRAVCGRGVCCL